MVTKREGPRKARRKVFRLLARDRRSGSSPTSSTFISGTLARDPLWDAANKLQKKFGYVHSVSGLVQSPTVKEARWHNGSRSSQRGQVRNCGNGWRLGGQQLKLKLAMQRPQKSPSAHFHGYHNCPKTSWVSFSSNSWF